MMRPAVVVGLHPTGIGIVRSLSRYHVPVFALEPPGDCHEAYSRLCNIEYCPDLRRADVLVEHLRQLARRFDDRPVLCLSNDDAVQIVSDNREELEDHYRFALPPKEVVNLLLQKTRFGPWATEQRLPVPSTIVSETAEQALSVMGRFRLPLLIKPAFRDPAWQKVYAGTKVHRSDTTHHFRQTVTEIFDRYGKPVLIQEYIEGEDHDVYFCLLHYDGNGRVTDSFVGRKLLQLPRLVGSTVIAESVECEEVRKLSIDLFDQVGFRGMGSVEFKRDARSGRFLISEPTVGRANLQSAIALAAGINIPARYYAQLAGASLQLPHISTRRVIWINEVRLSKYWKLYGLKHTNPLWLAGKLLWRRKGFAYFDFCDPAPAWHILTERFTKRDSEA